MELRLLKYYLTVAREGSITRAAEMLHITQPTLSRQLQQLEEELGAALFIRGKRQIALTEEGILFQRRAAEILELADKAPQELSKGTESIGGTIAIGCVETTVSRMLPDILAQFSALYPKVRYHIYSAAGDDIRERLDKGLLDIGLLLEPVEVAKYDFLRLPVEERWGVLMRKGDPLAGRDTICAEELAGLPLILPQRAAVQNEIAGWFGPAYESLHIFATHNLLTNAALLAERGLGYVICAGGAFAIRESRDVCFVPFSPKRVTYHVLVFKKNQVFSAAAARMIRFIRDACKAW